MKPVWRLTHYSYISVFKSISNALKVRDLFDKMSKSEKLAIHYNLPNLHAWRSMVDVKIVDRA